MSNRLGGLPGDVYRMQADAPVHWQPWTEKAFEYSKDSNKLILLMIVLPQQPNYLDALSDLYSDEATIREINDKYVPVLIDANSAREMGVLVVDLCAEIGADVQLPMMVWLTSDGNPVAWIPLPANPAQPPSNIFRQSSSMVSRMWKEDPSYVIENSKRDQANRKDRMIERRKAISLSENPGQDALRALRQLTSLYDPVSHTFDGAGGLFPCGAMDLLSMGARLEGIPEDVRQRAEDTLQFLLADLLSSAMFDPLDGRVFSSRLGMTWSLPSFYQDCETQARVAVSLFDAYEVTSDKRALARALGILDFIQKHYRTPDGLYALGAESQGKTEDWLWSIEEVKTALNEDEFRVWKAATGMRDIGNLPSEVDPLRVHFRSNSLGFFKSLEEVAKDSGADLEITKGLYESARVKLLEVREKRLGKVTSFSEPTAISSFRVVSAYASAYRITGEKKYLKAAVESLEIAKKQFSSGPSLRVYSSDGLPSLNEARAFVYGLAMLSALDVAAITLDEKWLLWSDDLATTAMEKFSREDYLQECPESANLINLPITNLTMIFDESTAGLFLMAKSRMEALNRPILRSFGEEVYGLPINAVERPVLHTDVIQAFLVETFGNELVYGPAISAEMREKISRAPFKGTARRAGIVSNAAGLSNSPNEAVRISPKRKFTILEDPSEINLPSLRNP